MRTGGILPEIRNLAVGDDGCYPIGDRFKIVSYVWRIRRESAGCKDFEVTDDTDNKTVTVKRIK